ncbi:amino acid ABC transporter permease [Roseibium sp. HPY-6]|uniref:amino acid ABC transporter permease n=1 Tax=Roseibium sp. HPY-6 TaxID=3229852 RepID=UPI00338E8F99
MIEFSNWDIIRNLLLAARWTLALSAIAFLGGGLVGLGIMTMRISSRRYVRTLAKAYIGLFQGTPLILQLFIIFFGLPMLGLRTDAWGTAALGLTFYASAFLGEIWRGGVQAVDKGQWDGSAALGLSWYQQMRLIILPQAFDYVRAPTVGFLVQLIKATAVTSIIGFEELVRVAGVINNATFEPLKVYGFVALIFFLICLPLTLYSRILERKAAQGG